MSISIDIQNDVALVTMDDGKANAVNFELMEALNAQAQTGYFLKTFALITIVIGVASALLLSTYRRRPEIGIMRAMGAERGFVIFVFVTQGALIGLMGGIMGAALGYLALLPFPSRDAFEPGTLPMDITQGSYGLAITLTVIGAILASILAGVGLVALALFVDNGELAIGLAGGVPHWIVLGALGLVVEEVVFRGVLYDGVEALGGRTNAAVSVTVLSALMSLNPLFAVSAAAAALARAWSGSLVPALALRITWVVGLGLATAGLLTY